MISKISARRATASANVLKANTKYKAAGEFTLLIEDSTSKENCREKLRNYLTELGGKKAIVMIFADWCGHCHQLMPRLADLENDYPVIMVNGEHLPQDLMAAEDPLMDENIVEYFPNIRVWDGTKLVLKQSLEEARNAVVGEEMSTPPPPPFQENVLSGLRSTFQYGMNREERMVDAAPTKDVSRDNAPEYPDFLDSLF